MQGLARISVMRPVFATVLVLALAVVGLFAIPRLGVDRFPTVDFPWISIVTTLPGATPAEIETEITEEIERQVNTVSGIEQITSTSSEGISVVSIQFALEKDPDIAAQEISSKVDLALPNLPKEAEKPVIQKQDSTSAPVLRFVVSSEKASIRELTEYADKRLRSQIESISGVGEVQIIGGQEREIHVLLDPYRLRAYNLTAVDVQRALQTQNLNVPGGSLDEGARRLSVRTRGRVDSIAAMEQIIVKNASGQPIRLQDVARVEDAEAEAETLALINGKPAVLLAVKKQSGANTVAVITAVKTKLKELEPSLPSGYETRIVSDQSKFILASLHAVQEHLILGAILASVVVLIFLWNWRSTLIASIAIPTSLISTFALMQVMGFTLNIITLLALTLAVGIVIDDAIIVLENIYKYLEEKEMTPFEAAIEATKEIGLAVLATTMSLVAVFLPVAFMTGIVGRFLNSFGLTMAFAILVSLFVAFTLTPMLSARWLRAPKKTLKAIVTGGSVEDETNGHHEERKGIFARFEDWYARIVRWSLGHRWVIVVASVLTLLATGPIASRVGQNFLPNEDESQFIVSVRAPEGTSLSATGSMMERIATEIRSLPEVEDTMVTAGDDPQQTQNLGSISVQMRPVEERKTNTSQYDLMDRVRKEILTKYPRELRINVSPPNAFGGGAEWAIEYVISGPDLEVLNRTAQKVVADLRKVPGVADADTSVLPAKPELGVSVDRDLASDLGVSVSDIASSLRILVAGEKVSEFDEDGQQYEVRLRALPEYRDRQDSLALFTVPSSKDGLKSVPVDQVVTFAEGNSPSVIERYARTRRVTIKANILPGASQQAIQDKLVALVKAENLPVQYRTDFAGSSRELAKTFTAFGLAFLLSIIFMYLILAAQFESWLHPITILLSLPLTVPFALLSVVLLGQSLNIYSMLGILVLFGVVKKNAILQVDHANQLREKGLERTDAIVLSSRDRLRPILMTTIAFVAGMLPLLFSRGTGAATNQATGGVIIGGQVLSLALTLIAIPVFYSLMDDLTVGIARLKGWVARKLSRGEGEEAETVPAAIPARTNANIGAEAGGG
jgi:HAE1 family hydrophobic/amphiphilic exporter-1